MRYKLLSFDLQGTLSNSQFSDDFWLRLLPILYAQKYEITVAQAKDVLGQQFREMGRYDYRYYSPAYWLDRLCPGESLQTVSSQLHARPEFFSDTASVIAHLVGRVPLAILSTTTHDFITIELSGFEHYFNRVISCLDDFSTAGKTPGCFHRLATLFSVECQDVLHVGDCREMDIQNAISAGCDALYFDKSLPREQLISSLLDRLGAQELIVSSSKGAEFTNPAPFRGGINFSAH